MTSGKSTVWRPRPGKRLAGAGFFLLLLAGVSPCALAQQQAPPDSGQQRPPVQDAQPRRNYQMGTTQGNIHIDRDQNGNSVMEVTAPPPKQEQQQPLNMGPIIVVPKVNQK
jgi:hypothetical protein